MSSEYPMTSNKPYLIRAIYDWLLDNGLTPYLLVNAKAPDCTVPLEHVKEGKIVLNINPAAIQGLLMNNTAFEFKTRFSGVSRQIYVPIKAILAIYAKENGEGMAFPEEVFKDSSTPNIKEEGKGKPNFKIVK